MNKSIHSFSISSYSTSELTALLNGDYEILDIASESRGMPYAYDGNNAYVWDFNGNKGGFGGKGSITNSHGQLLIHEGILDGAFGPGMSVNVSLPDIFVEKMSLDVKDFPERPGFVLIKAEAKGANLVAVSVRHNGKCIAYGNIDGSRMHLYCRLSNKGQYIVKAVSGYRKFVNEIPYLFYSQTKQMEFEG